ncbi:hypothetical protein ACLI4Z_15710 [Natrialbaceae archaeon A-arb3/5]
MSNDDSAPDDGEEPSNDHDEGTDEDESVDVPIDESQSDDDSESREDENVSDPSDSNDRRSDERKNNSPYDDPSRAESEPEDGNEGTHWLSSLLSALDRIESGSTSGRRRSDRTVLDYDISIRSSEDAADDGPGLGDTPFTGPRSDRDWGRDRDQDWSRTRRRRSSSSNAHHLTTRQYDDELLVTADVAGVDPDDVTVGFDDLTLVVAVSGRELDRTDVPWRDRTAKATVRNGVLTVRVRPDSKKGETDVESSSETEGGDE